MKIIITFLFGLLLIIPVQGQRYNSRITPDGTIFFVNPQELASLKNLRQFEYDMTLLSWKDSVTVNYTIESSSMKVPEGLKIIIDGNIYDCDTYSVLFIDMKRQYYRIRITSKIPMLELARIVESSDPPIFVFVQEGIQKEATYTSRKWKKGRKQLWGILQLFDYSKNNL